MAWTNIANANLDVGAPVRSVDLLALRDNITALANGDTGAPPIKAQALGSGQTGNAPIFAARAWVSFDGTGTFTPNPSTSKIRGSGNVSSISKNSSGDYTVNFATSMPNVNYVVNITVGSPSNAAVGARTRRDLTNTTSAIRLQTFSGGFTPFDLDDVNVSIFG